MKDLLQNFDSTDIHSVLDEAEKLAHQFKHGFIDYNHLYVALFNIDCEARDLCKNFNIDNWIPWLQQVYPESTDKILKDSLPFSSYASNVIRYAKSIAYINKDTHVCSVHLLLALLCLNCDITEAINKMGVIFEDIAEQYYQRAVYKSYPPFPIIRKRPYSRLEKFFLRVQSREEKIEELLNRASELFLYHQYDDCLSVCEAGLSLQPDHYDFRTISLDSAVRKRDFQTAEQHAVALIKDYPSNWDFKFILAYTYNQSGRLNDAAQIIDELLANNPQNVSTLHNKGNNLYLQGKFDEAIPFLERSIAINPTYPYSYNSLGFVYYKLGRNNKALELINKSLELDKGNSYAYKNKGIVFLEQNNKEEALKNFKLALRYGYTKKWGNEVLELIQKASM